MPQFQILIETMQSFSESLNFFQLQEQKMVSPSKMSGRVQVQAQNSRNGGASRKQSKLTCVAQELYDKPVSLLSLPFRDSKIFLFLCFDSFDLSKINFHARIHRSKILKIILVRRNYFNKFFDTFC